MKEEQIKALKEALFRDIERYNGYEKCVFFEGARQLRHAMIMANIVEEDSDHIKKIDEIIEKEIDDYFKLLKV